MHAAPGGPWDARTAAKQLDPALAPAFNRHYGLHKPVWQQRVIYLGNAVHFDFGSSYTQEGTSVVQVILQGFPSAARIGLYALLLAVALGVAAAIKQNTAVDCS